MRIDSRWQTLEEMMQIGAGGFRLMLCFLVVVHHISSLAVGGFAVAAFFVLSGFWMASVWREKYAHKGYLRFMEARILRLLPLFLLANLLAYLIQGLTRHVDLGAEWAKMSTLDALAFALPNLFILGYNTLPYRALGPAWSLDVELQFYLLLPVFMWLARQTLSLTMLGLICLAVAVHGSPMQHTVLGHAPYFFLGILAHELKWVPSSPLVRNALLFGLAMVVLVLALPAWRFVLLNGAHVNLALNQANQYFTVVLVVVMLPVILWSVRSRGGRFDKAHGDISYSVYLVHAPLAVVYDHFCGAMPPMQRLPFAAAYLVAAGGISVLVWYGFDRPLLAYRARMLKAAMNA
jgi:peptidoglycan/LPS O-acetylase OafA/YrhL